RARVPHHLIGEIPLAHSFDVARYRAAAFERLDQIHARGAIPLVVGGSGLYLRSLARGLAELPPADLNLRAELAESPLPELLARLTALDPESARTIDRNNPRRVI